MKDTWRAVPGSGNPASAAVAPAGVPAPDVAVPVPEAAVPVPASGAAAPVPASGAAVPGPAPARSGASRSPTGRPPIRSDRKRIDCAACRVSMTSAVACRSWVSSSCSRVAGAAAVIPGTDA
ncbi:hypothetical protein GA0115240_170422 [Streptomyces sp. DvalAA-14]|nr:hypothetical protein GA0115240_170422 [Streptomyces sp. DvalAA-14]